MTQLDRLESLGYRVTLGEDGKIRAALPGGLAPPPEAKELLAWCRNHREEVKDALIARSGDVSSTVKVDAWLIGWDDSRLRAWQTVFEKGLATLVKVVGHRDGRQDGDIERIEVHYIPIAEEWVIAAEVNER